MIYLVEKVPSFRGEEGYLTYWHVPPPASHSTFVVVQDEWTKQGNRHIHAWRYPAFPAADEQGWIPVPAWWREQP